MFTAADLARVRVAPRPDPLWETVLSLHQLALRGTAAGSYAPWAGWVRTVARDCAPAARLVYGFAPPARYWPDFLTPTAGGAGLDEAVDTVLHTPVRRVRAELARAGAAHPLPPVAADLAEGRTERIAELGAALRRYHADALAPFADRIDAYVGRHRAQVADVISTDGVGAGLGGLGSGMTWRSPVLTAPYPADVTIELGGRGLTLLPSFFCRRMPVALADENLDPVLVYPVDPPVGWMQPGAVVAGRDRKLASLVGAPRAALLEALREPCGTSELSARTGLSLSSASEHATI
ncbi:MAG TPA: transcriptional regulator, partial [Kribbellaceae bacterium]